MPNPPLHIRLAQTVAEHLRHPTLDGNPGYLLLGSTSPDSRAITRERREEYHFASLDFDAVGAGARGLFMAHPHLARTSALDGPTRAFVAGYVSHLVADETWIVEVFRPYFGNREVFDDQACGKVMDRALQLDLDRQSMEAARAALPLLAAAGDPVQVEFIGAEALSRWRRWVTELVSRDFTWERLAFMARRIAAGDDAHPAHGIAAEFVQGMPGSLERLYRRVPQERVRRFMDTAVGNAVSAVGDYLS